MNINHTRDLVRMATAFYDRTGKSPEQVQRDLQAVSLATWSFVRAMKRHLSPPAEDEEDFKKELYERLPEAQAQAIIDAAHRPNRALYDLSLAIENLPMHFSRKNDIHSWRCDYCGRQSGVLRTSLDIPCALVLQCTRHSARFLAFWLLLFPFALWEPLGNTWDQIGVIPVVFFLSAFLFGIDELVTQLEEPFTNFDHASILSPNWQLVQ